MTFRRFADLDNIELRAVDVACEAFEQVPDDKLERSSIEQHIDAAPERIRNVLFQELLAIELELRSTGGRLPASSEYHARFPERQEHIRWVFARVAAERPAIVPQKLPTSRCDVGSTELPTHIGRYRIEQLLGRGGFGLVYKAHDDSLDRTVAIKVPHAQLVSRAEDATAYLAEAKTVANLDHSHIVPVYDFGSSADFPCYVVSKYIDGTSLAAKLKSRRAGDHRAAAELVATVAAALHYAHQHGLVHRDVKPGNILIDSEGKAYLADFGLALREEDFGQGPVYAGTPSYMSPEQARGEGHRVDGRSDVFSLGVVLYEMLVGCQPFRGSTQAELLERVMTCEPRPPRQCDETLPREVERICLKALSKRTSKRYSSVHDMATDLRHFLADACGTPSPHNSSTNVAFASLTSADSTSSPSPGADSQPIKVIPKGLQSFDKHDADFFLELVPGPRDREGLPDSVRFWKNRIEETDGDKTFSVGLIYGPSGCGKSSLVKAGLLPRLSAGVTAVYVEATGVETEARLLRGLRQRCGPLPPDLDLKQTLVALRHGHGVVASQKVLIILDQFEQWLHAARADENTELVQALRQCDGGQVQCLVLVRDEFWLAVSRFMLELEVDLVPGRNIAMADLFDLDHAGKVLAAFGRAFGKLPENPRDTSKRQQDFLAEALRGLLQDGKIVCVRLALFAEMMKGRPWMPATLKSVGGTEGVRVTFLEEAFSGRAANPKYRAHQEAARAVLKALLPAADSDIKGHMRSEQELFKASGYRRERDFDDLIKVLDSEIRFITPTDPEGHTDDTAVKQAERGQRFYQLTHDYLVPALREWLTRKQKETRRGRAELRLSEWVTRWQNRPANRNLPAWWEYVNIRAFTSPKTWTESQREMMRKAARVHGMRWGSGLLAVLVIAIVVQQFVAATRAQNVADRVHTAVRAVRNSRGVIVPLAIEYLEDFPRETVLRELRDRFGDSDPSRKLPLAYALAHFGSIDTDFLVAQVQAASVEEVDNLVTALGRSQGASRQSLRTAARRADADHDWQLKQRLALVALYLGDVSVARDMCQLREDPIQRTIFIAGVSSWQGNASRLAEICGSVADPALRSGLCLRIGSTPANQLTAETKQTWKPVLSDWYQRDADSGVHSAAGWALRNWELELPVLAPSAEPIAGRAWHVNSAGMTMLKIPAGSFFRALSKTHDPWRTKQNGWQKVTLTRSFLISDREVSVGQFQQMMDDPSFPKTEKPPFTVLGRPTGAKAEISPTVDHPIQQINWNGAVQFCNWLSHKEDLTPCYERTGKTWKIPTGDFEEWRLIPDASGYRLPTEAEWEYACRAGTDTDFPSGDDVTFLPQYVVYGTHQTEVCGTKLPNGWGLFDALGNVKEWCQDWDGGVGGSEEAPFGGFAEVTDPAGPQEHPLLFKILRGYEYNVQARVLRKGGRESTAFTVHRPTDGFRPVRTCAP